MWLSRYQLALARLHINWLSCSRLTSFLLASSLVITTSCLASMTPVVVVDSCFLNAPINQPNINKLSLNKLNDKDLSYWDHTNIHSDEFSGLRFFNAQNDNSKYRLTAVGPELSVKEQPVNQQSEKNECYNREIILVKKLIHNKRQHANGIEMRLKEREFTFGNLASFKMRFQLNRALSFTPQVTSLLAMIKRTSNKRISKEKEQTLSRENEKQPLQKIINDLIDQNITFKLMFYGENNSEHTVKTAYAEKLIVLPPSLPDVVLDTDSAISELTDSAWLELEIKRKDLTSYWQQNWQETPATLSELSQQPILGFILVAETPSGKTLESLVGGFSEANVKLKVKLKNKELFIENYIRLGSMSIELRTK